jgi:hypothetical protein
MRGLLLIVALAASTSSAVAEVWRGREGECGDWRSRWDVRQDQDGVWAGTIDHVHVGGPCGAGTDQTMRTEVQAVIAGESFFAARRAEDRTVCSYHGRIKEDRVRGFALCEGSAERLIFALRFPPGGDRDARLRHEGRQDQQDEFLDDPQTYNRRQPPTGFNLEFQLGPRR